MVLSVFKMYRLLFILFFVILIGGIVGYVIGFDVVVVKFFGDLFFNLMFMIIVFFVFFSVVLVIVNMNEMKCFGKIMLGIVVVFVVIVVVLVVLGFLGVLFYNLLYNVDIFVIKELMGDSENIVEKMMFLNQFVSIFIVFDFVQLFLKEYIL